MLCLTVMCICVITTGTQVVVGYADGVVKLWDLKTGTSVHTWQHSSSPGLLHCNIFTLNLLVDQNHRFVC